jgi:hypothetical protein
MFSEGDGHVLVLAASIRTIEHLLYCFVLETELATVPAKVLEQWASKGFPTPDNRSNTKLPANRFLTKSLTWSKVGKRLIFNTNSRARASRNSRLTIEPRFHDLHELSKIEH